MFDRFNDCVTYTYKNNVMDLFIPQKEIFQPLCVSYDKTYLFIMSVLRCAVYLMVTGLYYDADLYVPFYVPIFILLVIVTIINLILLLVVMLKRPKATSFSLEDINKDQINYPMPNDMYPEGDVITNIS